MQTVEETTRLIESFLDGRADSAESTTVSIRPSSVSNGEAMTFEWRSRPPFAAWLRALPTAVFVPSGLHDPEDRGARDMIWWAAERRGLRVFMSNELLIALASPDSSLGQQETVWADGLSSSWKPARVSGLLIGESPGECGALYLYTHEVARRHEELYRALASAVLGELPRRAGGDKSEHLDQLRDRGVFLIDMCKEPVGALEASKRLGRLETSVEACLSRICELAPDRVLICDPDVYELLAPHLDGLLAHTSPLPFPRVRDRFQFIGGARKALGGVEETSEPWVPGLTPQLGARFKGALSLTVRLHGDQERMGSGVSYLGHLLGVASIIIDAGGDEDQAVAGLLHDAIEDAGGDVARREIEGRFGSRVRRIVDECSDTDVAPKPPWRERKETYLAHLAVASSDALLISLADKLYNVRSMLLDYATVGDTLWGRFKSGREGQLWYYESLARIFLLRSPGPLAEELMRSVERLDQISDPSR